MYNKPLFIFQYKEKEEIILFFISFQQGGKIVRFMRFYVKTVVVVFVLFCNKTGRVGCVFRNIPQCWCIIL